ncbi:MAG: enoyl-CoA hydratase/isomerase family protein [Burkholderiales bacterium]|nr:enoyl-CoA hydratase/isomerase family protein [Burkholderiales bacterium]
MSAPVLAVSRDGAVGVIELARPEKFNCLSLAVLSAIDAALDAFEAPDAGVRAVLVRAQGKHFCTGADLEEVKGLRQSAAALRDFIARGHRVMKRLEKSDLPVVAACNGLALAGGSELMLSCDVVFMASDAKVGDQHAQFGLVPGWGGTQRFPRTAGLRRSLDLMFSGRWIDAPTALAWGLANYVVEPEALHAEAMAYCQKLATRSRTGLAAMKRLARQGMEGQPLAGLTLEEQVVSAALLGEDVSEGLAAFEARRTPQFKA